MSASSQFITFAGRRPRVDPAAWIAPNATLIGYVTLAGAASVFYGAVLRGDADRIVVGEGSNLQDGVVVHVDAGFPALVGRNVTVGHRAVLHGCVVEDGALIGMSATALNGAVIGEGSLVAAGSVVLEGTDRSGWISGRRGAGQGPPQSHRGREDSNCLGCSPLCAAGSRARASPGRSHWVASETTTIAVVGRSGRPISRMVVRRGRSGPGQSGGGASGDARGAPGGHCRRLNDTGQMN